MTEESFESASPIRPVFVGNPQPAATSAGIPDLRVARRQTDPEQNLPIDRLPPHSIDAERGSLGCCLVDGTFWVRLWEKVKDADAFYDLRHQRVFKAMRDLHQAGQPIDVITVGERLRDRQELLGVGNLEYLQELENAVPSAHNLPAYLDILSEKWLLRRLVQNATRLVGRVYDGDDPKAIALGVEADLGSMALQLSGRNGHLPAIVKAHDFVQAEIPPPLELIRGILHRGTKMVIGGGSKSFKTWIQLDLALSVAYRRPWLNFDTSGGRVLFVNMEIQPAFFQQRLMEVAFRKGIKLNDPMIDLWNLRGFSAPYSKILPLIVERIKSEEYALIVLDPIYKLYGTTDENNASEVAQLLNALENVCCSTGAAVAFGAHYSKGNQSQKESIDRMSGSGVFARDPDSILAFTRHEEEECFTVESTLRNLSPIEPFVVRWQYPLMHRDDTLDPSRLMEAGKRDRPLMPPARVRELCDELGSTKIQLSRAICDDCGCVRQNGYRYLSTAETAGVIQWSQSAERYFRSQPPAAAEQSQPTS